MAKTGNTSEDSASYQGKAHCRTGPWLGSREPGTWDAKGSQVPSLHLLYLLKTGALGASLASSVPTLWSTHPQGWQYRFRSPSSACLKEDLVAGRRGVSYSKPKHGCLSWWSTHSAYTSARHIFWFLPKSPNIFLLNSWLESQAAWAEELGLPPRSHYRRFPSHRCAVLWLHCALVGLLSQGWWADSSQVIKQCQESLNNPLITSLTTRIIPSKS